MAIFVNDTFTDSDGTNLTSHTGETGATWVYHGSYGTTLEINTNECRSSNSGSTVSVAYASGSPANAEYDVEGDVTAGDASSTSRDTQIIGRIDTGADTFYAVKWNSSTFTLRKRVAGSSTNLDSWATSWSAEDVLPTKLELRDAAKKGYVSGTERVTSSDNSIIPAGKAGLMIRGRFNGIWRIDNFVATDAAVGGVTVPIMSHHYTKNIGAGR